VLAVITKFHVSLVVDDPLNVRSIYGILSSMAEHIHRLSPEKYAEEQPPRLGVRVLQNGKEKVPCWALNARAVTSLGSEGVAADIVEDVVLGKHTMIYAKVMLIPGIVERCQLSFCYSSLGGEFCPMKVIVGKSKDDCKLHHLQLNPVTFNGEVESSLIPIATSSSGGIKLSH
jgi:hypothetical protein